MWDQSQNVCYHVQHVCSSHRRWCFLSKLGQSVPWQIRNKRACLGDAQKHDPTCPPPKIFFLHQVMLQTICDDATMLMVKSGSTDYHKFNVNKDFHIKTTLLWLVGVRIKTKGKSHMNEAEPNWAKSYSVNTIQISKVDILFFFKKNVKLMWRRFLRSEFSNKMVVYIRSNLITESVWYGQSGKQAW